MVKKISAIILTKNEADIINDCLESVKWADEIVCVDSGSTDETINILNKFGAKVFLAQKNTSFSDWRNLGAKNAKGEWLLYVDADERVSPGLRMEILKTIDQKNGKSFDFVAYTIPRKNIRLTKILYFGGWWPDRVLRLMKKDKLIKWEGELHEQPEIDGGIGQLNEALTHFSHRGKYEHKVKTTINWSKIEAQKLFEAKHPPMNIVRFFSAMWREFYKRMIKEKAFKDGLEGVLEAIYQVFSVFVTYARLWEMQIQVNSSKYEVK